MDGPRILLVGLGGFGRNHLRAWHHLRLGAGLHVAELNPDLHAEASAFNLPAERLTTDVERFIDEVDVVDIVTPSTSHYDLIKLALERGKDVFVEKPMTMTSGEAEALARLADESGRLLQVGFYYRFHPMSPRLRRMITDGELGDIRYLSGNFMGFKRARTDVGVTHTDGIHFIDLFNWLLGAAPSQVYAVTRDHFNRGLEDFSVVMLEYPSGAVAKIESGYIQPGRWRDKVVPGAFTSKEIFVSGSRATVEVDFETEYMRIHGVQHEFLNNTWTPVSSGSNTPLTSTADPIQMIAAELTDFLACTVTRRRPSADAVGSGVVLARIMESLYESAASGSPVRFAWSAAEVASLTNAPVTDAP